MTSSVLQYMGTLETTNFAGYCQRAAGLGCEEGRRGQTTKDNEAEKHKNMGCKHGG